MKLALLMFTAALFLVPDMQGLIQVTIGLVAIMAYFRLAKEIR